MNASRSQAWGEMLAAQVATAIERHRDQAGFVRLVAAELPRPDREGWRAVADALETGDVATGIASAEGSLGPWIPLFASPEGDPRLPARILQTAARPPRASGASWLLVAYPLVIGAGAVGLLAVFSATVLAMFDAIFRDFGMTLPAVTRLLLAIGPFLTSIWQPLLVVAGLAVAWWWLAVRLSAGSAAVTAAFTRSMARLVAAEMPTDEAVAIAAHVVGAKGPDAGQPRRPLTYAAAAALDFAPRTSAVLLDAVAACHEDRCRGATGVGQWLASVTLIVAVGLLVGFVAVGLLLPLFSLVSDLS